MLNLTAKSPAAATRPLRSEWRITLGRFAASTSPRAAGRGGASSSLRAKRSNLVAARFWIASSPQPVEDGVNALLPRNDEIQNRSRGALLRPSYAHHHDAIPKNSPPANKREAKRRKAQSNHWPRSINRRRRRSMPGRGCAP